MKTFFSSGRSGQTIKTTNLLFLLVGDFINLGGVVSVCFLRGLGGDIFSTHDLGESLSPDDGDPLLPPVRGGEGEGEWLIRWRIPPAAEKR